MNSFNITPSAISTNEARTKAAMRGRVSQSLALTIALLAVGEPAFAQCLAGNDWVLAFDGSNDVVVVPHVAALDGFGDFTLEAWTKATPGADYPILSKGHPGANRSYWFGGGAQSAIGWRPRLVLNYTNPPLTAPALDLFAPTVVPYNGWHHIAASRTGSAVSILVDGVVATSATFAQGLSSNPAQILSIGGDYSGGHFPGSLAEIRIWNVGRTPAQIAQFMHVGLSGFESGLVGYWRFDEGSGQFVQNAAVATGAAANGTRGATSAAGNDDPTWALAPQCGQINTPCATLTVNSVGASARGPFLVAAPAGSTLTFGWSGPPNQPLALFASSALSPGLVLAPGLLVDLNLAFMVLLFSGFDPILGPLFFTTAAGTSTQAFTVPTVLGGSVLNVQGLVFDTALTCSTGIGLMTTASFAIHLTP